jgi:hypothetical protein
LIFPIGAFQWTWNNNELRKGGSVSDKVLIAEKKDSNFYFETKTGHFYNNIIDGLGNRWVKIKANTIDDIDTKNWKWTRKGKELFGEELRQGGAISNKKAHFLNELLNDDIIDSEHGMYSDVKEALADPGDDKMNEVIEEMLNNGVLEKGSDEYREAKNLLKK